MLGIPDYSCTQFKLPNIGPNEGLYTTGKFPSGTVYVHSFVPGPVTAQQKGGPLIVIQQEDGRSASATSKS